MVSHIDQILVPALPYRTIPHNLCRFSPVKELEPNFPFPECGLCSVTCFQSVDRGGWWKEAELYREETQRMLLRPDDRGEQHQ